MVFILQERIWGGNVNRKCQTYKTSLGIKDDEQTGMILDAFCGPVRELFVGRRPDWLQKKLCLTETDSESLFDTNYLAVQCCESIPMFTAWLAQNLLAGLIKCCLAIQYEPGNKSSWRWFQKDILTFLGEICWLKFGYSLILDLYWCFALCCHTVVYSSRIGVCALRYLWARI